MQILSSLIKSRDEIDFNKSETVALKDSTPTSTISGNSQQQQQQQQAQSSPSVIPSPSSPPPPPIPSQQQQQSPSFSLSSSSSVLQQELTTVDILTTNSLAMTTDDEEYHREDVRLRTFDRWPHAFLDKRKMAQIGFLYKGTSDAVKCHFCKVEIGRWEENDNELTEHLRWSPNCPLLKRRETDNVPIDANELDRILPAATYDVCGPCGNGVVDIRPGAFAESSFSIQQNLAIATSPSIMTTQTQQQVPPNITNATNTNHNNATTIMVHDVTAVGTGSNASNIISVSSVTAAIITNSVEPITAGSSSSSSFSTATTSSAPSSSFASTSSFRPQDVKQPIYPEYALETVRLRSYADWPKTMKQKPKELSDAGFYYTQKGDRVRCFSCGGGLRDWDEHDVPFEQHALWFKHCAYLRLMKGPEYIQYITESGGSTNNASTGELSTTSSSSSCGVASPLNNNNNIMSSRSSNNNNNNNNSNNNDDNINEAKLCKICYTNEYNTAFFPCGHVVACTKCASSVTKCPLCRRPFETVMRVYFS